eukprot:416310-Pelagomonas_calceolata.AAC.2
MASCPPQAKDPPNSTNVPQFDYPCSSKTFHRVIIFEQLVALGHTAVECMHSNISQSCEAPWEAPLKRQKLSKLMLLLLYFVHGVEHNISHHRIPLILGTNAPTLSGTESLAISEKMLAGPLRAPSSTRLSKGANLTHFTETCRGRDNTQ